MTMPRRRNNRERQDIPRNERKSSAFTMILSAILGAIFGIIGGLSSDYLKIYFHFLDISDIHAYMLILSPYKNSFNLQLVFVNSGNRQGVISELEVGYSTKKFGISYVPFRTPQPTVEGVPALLNPGDMRLVTIKGTLPINNMHENGSPVNQPMGSATSAKVDEREVTIVLQFRSLDFRGKRYAGKWDVGRMSMTSDNFAGLELYSYALPIFDKRYFSGETIWFSFPPSDSLRQ